MRILSLNVGQPRDLHWGGKVLRSAIFKSPVQGRVAAGREGLEGDAQADLSVHGGVDKAVYAYPSEHYDFWRAELGVDELTWGAFGENLTTIGLLEEDVEIGDRFRAGEVELEVSQPRIPCSKLAARHGRPDLPKRFLRTDRPGIYFRVVREGRLAAGDPIECIHHDARGLRLLDILTLARGEGDEPLMRLAVDHPHLAQVWRSELARRLERSRTS